MVTKEIILVVQYIISMTSFGAELSQRKYMHMDKGEKSLTMEENLNLSTVILTEGKRMGGICLFSSEQRKEVQKYTLFALDNSEVS